MNVRASRALAAAAGAVLTLGLGMPRDLAAQQPGVTLPYSVRLTDEAGVAVPDGDYGFLFEIHDDALAGERLWFETQLGARLTGGGADLALGASTPIPDAAARGKERWLSVSVHGPGDATFTLLSPRQRLADVTAPSAVSVLSCPHSHFGDRWTGASGEYGLKVENTGAGDAIQGITRATDKTYAGVWGYNTAPTGSGSGVYGRSLNGVGVYGVGDAGDGIEGTTKVAGASGVYGHAQTGTGVTARSTSGFGARIGGGGDGSWTDGIGDLRLEGNRGELYVTGEVLNLFSNNWLSLDLDNNNNNSNAKLEVWNGADALVFTVDEQGNTVAEGTKSASVRTEDFGRRLLYSIESTEVWFEDIGTVALKDGVATVTFEPIFAQTVNLASDYRVFVTPVCKEPVVAFVSDKSAAGFTVQGVTLGGKPSACGIDYRVIAKRLGHESARLAPVDPADTSRGGR